MATPEEIVRFDDVEPPPGASPWVDGAGPGRDVVVVEPDPAWTEQAARLVDTVGAALGRTAVSVEHVGSTSVPGLAAKPLLDLLLVVPDPDDEDAYVPALESQGFRLVVREPWWQGHRLLRHHDPRTNLHVFHADGAEVARMRMFRDWLRTHPDDRDLYADAKRAASAAASDAGEHVMQYNARKQDVVRAIHARMFAAHGYPV
ncbi:MULTISPECIES: GrpB family protein [unclassified Aeromicrobium]|uniref:GrpB family protein n=1 Tax=unclassified Aeromicrobium TaxID=2633570 RepID=UPI000AC17733|nr:MULTISPECIES: GrpB family protein [unclassified Aeromicrobium]